MGFTKLDEGILQSSVMGESGDTFKVFIALLAACKQDGIARVSPVFLSGVCRISLKKARSCIEKLKSPDLDSRSKNDEGRRIREIDGGFEIINYQKYRRFTYQGGTEAARKRKYRERKINELRAVNGTNMGQVTTVHGHSASASASASASEAFKSKEQKQDHPNPTWRTSYLVYKAQHDTAVTTLLSDSRWIAAREKFNPGVDVTLTVQKAASEFWGTEAGWKHKRKSRTAEIDWRATYTQSVSRPSNRVWLPRAKEQTAPPYTPSYWESADAGA